MSPIRSLLSLSAFLLLGGVPARAQSAVNPLQGDLGVHDPVMIKAGRTYFIFATGNGVSMKTSADRVTWRNAGRALTTLPAWHKEWVPNNTGHLWAPDIHYRAGKYWLYYSVSTFGSQVSAIGLATADSLDPAANATRWTDQGLVVKTDGTSNHNAIDPNVVVDAEGVPWLSYGSFWSGLKLIKLDPATGKPAAGATLQSIASHPNGGIEAPFIQKRGPWYYLYVSWDRCCAGVSSTYNIRVGRSAQVTGPFLDSKGVDLRNSGGDLIDRGDDRWKGPGHNGIFVENDTTYLVNHAYDAQRNGSSTLWIRPLYWTPEGWPTLDPNRGSALKARPAARRTGHLTGAAAEVDALGRWGREGARRQSPGSREPTRATPVHGE